MCNIDGSNETGESAYNFAYRRRLPSGQVRVSISMSKYNLNQQTNLKRGIESGMLVPHCEHVLRLGKSHDLGSNVNQDVPYMIFFKDGATKSSILCSFSEIAALGYLAIWASKTRSSLAIWISATFLIIPSAADALGCHSMSKPMISLSRNS